MSKPLNILGYGQDLFYNKNKTLPICGDIIAYKKSSSKLEIRLITGVYGRTYYFREIDRQNNLLSSERIGRSVNFWFLKGVKFSEVSKLMRLL